MKVINYISYMKYDEVLKYWFPNEEFNKFWFNKLKETDEYIRDNFNIYLSEIMNEDPVIFYNSDELLAKIIVLDQFTRNIYRGSSRAYQNDYKALDLAKKYFSLEYHVFNSINKIIFALMPFRHSENIEHQKFVLNILKTLDNESNIYIKFYRASLKSYNIIKKYGKFPDRIKY